MGRIANSEHNNLYPDRSRYASLLFLANASVFLIVVYGIFQRLMSVFYRDSCEKARSMTVAHLSTRSSRNQSDMEMVMMTLCRG